MMARQLSPKQLARAIGSSESSVKRWVDDGAIHAGRTAGGHRRITLAEAIRFVRSRELEVVHPELFGIARFAYAENELEGFGDQLFRVLESGAAEEARDLVLSLLLRGHGFAEVCDGPVREALTRIGEIWLKRDDGVMIEHRATLICSEILSRVEVDFAPAPTTGPSAVGGAYENDQSTLATWMASLVLRSAGFRSVNLGARTPFEAILIAAERNDSSVVWASVTHVDDETRTRDDLIRFTHETRERGLTCLLGGRALPSLGVRTPDHVHVVGSFTELAEIGLRLL